MCCRFFHALRPPGRAWLGLLALVAGVSFVACCLGQPAAWRWERDNPAAWPWTLWTAALTHLSTGHWLANTAALAALALLGHRLRVGTGAVLALFIAWPLSTLGLLHWPQLTHYSGLSGLVHAGVGVLIAHAAINSIAKPVGFVLAAGLGLKLLSEHAWSAPLVYSNQWGFTVVQAAHLSGAAAGLLCGFVVLGAMRLRGFFSPAPSCCSRPPS